jgi:nucleotide-binding universal stress UspA family protein
MARVLVVARTPQLAARAARRSLDLFEGPHDVTVLVVVRPGLVATSVGDAGGLTSVAIDDDFESSHLLASAASAEADARSELEGALRHVDLHGRVRVRVEIGEPGEAYCRAAGEVRADLLVFGRRARTLSSRLRLGAVTHHVLEHAPCPVLILNEGEQ